MPAVISEIRLMIMSPEAGTMLDWAVEQWVESCQLNAERINAKRKAKIPNADVFSAKLAGASSKVYRQVLNPNFVSRKGLDAREIANRQGENLKNAYEKYNQGLNYAFETVDDETAKRYKDRVAKGKAHYKKGAGYKVNPFAGSRIYERGIMTLAGEWLTADPQVAGHLRPADKLVTGAPIMICRIEARSSLRVVLAGRLQQAGATIVDSTYDQTEIKKQNNITNQLVNGLVDPALGLVKFTTGGASCVDFVKDKQALSHLHIKVSKA